MRLYRVHYKKEGGQCAGFTFHSSKSAALRVAAKAAREEPEEYGGEPPEIEAIEVERNRAGIIAALNRYADHPNNG